VSLVSAHDEHGAVATTGLVSTGALATALRVLAQPVFIVKAVRDPSGTVTELLYVFLNQACARLLGRPVEPLVGRGLSEVFPSVRTLGIFDHYVAAIDSPSPVSFDVPGLHDNGVEGSFRLTASPFEDGLLVSASDISDVMRARQDAEADRAALRATADALLDPYVRLDAVRDVSGQIVDFVYVDANPAACAYNGLDYQDLVGSRLLDLQAGTGAGLLDQYRQVVETGEPLVLDDVVYAQELLDRAERHYDVRAVRVGDGLSYTWRDITDRHEAAMWLAESEEHYRLLAENASDVVMRLSADLRFEWVSGSIADVLGWAAPALLGQGIDRFIHPDELDLFRRTVADAGPESAARTDFRFLRSDGSYRWVACRTRTHRDADGNPVALLGGLVDIEARKQAEALKLDRMESLERFRRLTVGRELKMIELKKEIKNLKRLLTAGGNNPAPL